MRLRFVGPARKELLQAVEYYEQEAPGLGAELIEDISHSLATIRNTPKAGRSFTDDTRRLLLQHYPYYVVYRVEKEEILVVAVAHQRRRPGYWQDRL